MRRVMWIAAVLLACASCERSEPTHEQPVAVDPCALVARSDASALLGGPAVARSMGHGECRWTDARPDHSIWTLTLEISSGPLHPAPVIIVTRSEITYQGKLVSTQDDSPDIEHVQLAADEALVITYPFRIDIHWVRADLFGAHLSLTSSVDPVPAMKTKLAAMKQIAQQVNAALGTRIAMIP